MNNKMIFSIVMVVFWSIICAWSVSRVLDAQDDVRIAEQDVAKAKAEYEQSQRNIDAIINEGLNKQ